VLVLSATVKRRMFIAAGSISLGIGIIGIAVPLLPTTPFLLLSAYCYSRGSRRLRDRLLSNKIFGGYLKNYLEGKVMSRKAKICSLGILWGVIGFNVVFVVDSILIRIILLAVASGVTVHIARLSSVVPFKSAPAPSSNCLLRR